MKKEKKREKNLVSVMMIRTIPGAGTIGTKYSYSDYFWRIKANKEAGKRLIKCYPWTGIEKLLIRTWRDNEKFWNSLFKKFFFKFFSYRKKFLFNLIREKFKKKGDIHHFKEIYDFKENDKKDKKTDSSNINN